MGFERILLRFSKKGDARYLSHRDVMRLFARALRRADLPVRMTQGFNPHPRLSFPLALPLGVEADEEVVEVQFEPPIVAAEAAERLNAQLPQGIRVHSPLCLPVGWKTRVESIVWEAELPCDARLGEGDLARLLAREAIRVERTSPKGRRTVDVRPALLGMTLEGRRLTFELRVAEHGTPRPDEVVGALLEGQGEAARRARLRRTHVKLALPSGDARGPRPGR